MLSAHWILFRQEQNIGRKYLTEDSLSSRTKRNPGYNIIYQAIALPAGRYTIRAILYNIHTSLKKKRFLFPGFLNKTHTCTQFNACCSKLMLQHDLLNYPFQMCE